jgi:hypothetical protein
VIKTFIVGALVGLVLYFLIGGVGVAAGGSAFGVDFLGFAALGAFVAISLRSLLGDIGRRLLRRQR